MTGSTSSAHSDHDELLLARLYGGDLDVQEARLARNRVALCEACATAYADLGANAGLLRRMQVPARPRDFRLTPAEAARLAPRRGIRGRFDAVTRWLRPAGGALMAAGLAGVLLTANGSMVQNATRTAGDAGVGAGYQEPANAEGASKGMSVASRAISDAGQTARTGGGVPENTPLAHGTSTWYSSGSQSYNAASLSPAASSQSRPATDVGPVAGTTGTDGYSAQTQSALQNAGQKAAPAPSGPGSVSPMGLSGSGPDPRTVLAFGLSGLAILLGALLIVGPSVARRLPRRR